MDVRLSVTYTPCDKSTRKQTGDAITFTQFEERNLLFETCNNAESGDKYNDDGEMYAIDSGDESYDEPISTEMLEDIRDGSQYHPNVNRREASYKICVHIKQIQSEQKGVLKATRNMGKGLHKVFKTVVKEILQELTPMVESDSEVFHFIPEPRNFAQLLTLTSIPIVFA